MLLVVVVSIETFYQPASTMCDFEVRSSHWLWTQLDRCSPSCLMSYGQLRWRHDRRHLEKPTRLPEIVSVTWQIPRDEGVYKEDSSKCYDYSQCADIVRLSVYRRVNWSLAVRAWTTS